MPESYRFFRIAVVEDEPTLRDDMADFLSSYGHFVSASPSAEAFWRQHAGNLPDLVILDLGLPGSDGLTLAAQLRELPQPPCILMVTARSQREQRLEGYAAGADVYLVKPVDYQELAALIQRQCERRQTPARTQLRWQLKPQSWLLITPEGEEIQLSVRETLLLQEMARQTGIPVGHAQLIRAIGHQPDYFDPRRLATQIHRLRDKPLRQCGKTLPIESVYARGYALTEPLHIDGEHLPPHPAARDR